MTKRSAFYPVLSVFFLLLAVAGCRGGCRPLRLLGHDAGGPPSAASQPSARGASGSATQPAGVSRGSSVLSLLEWAERAELSINGLLVDFGTVDQYKYTRGETLGGWSMPRNRDDVSAAATTSTRGRLFVHQNRTGMTPQALVLRWRDTAPGTRLHWVHVNGRLAGSITSAGTWSTSTVPIPPDLWRVGANEILIREPSAADSPALEVDWAWLRESPTAALPQTKTRLGPFTAGGVVRRALLADSPRSYSFYHAVPAGTRLGFEYAAKGETFFTVRLETDDGEPREVFREAAQQRWQHAEVDLSRYAGQVVRLELATSGSGRGAWGEPTLMAPGEVQGPRPSGPPPRNVIVIVMDAVRARALRPYNPQSPIQAAAFEQLAAEGVLFRNHYTVMP